MTVLASSRRVPYGSRTVNTWRVALLARKTCAARASPQPAWQVLMDACPQPGVWQIVPAANSIPQPNRRIATRIFICSFLATVPFGGSRKKVNIVRQHQKIEQECIKYWDSRGAVRGRGLGIQRIIVSASAYCDDGSSARPSMRCLGPTEH